jgi:RHS repeat-associated protein
LTYLNTAWFGESRSYNARLQLSRLTAAGGYGAMSVDLEYRYAATQNNGQITQMKDWVTGEEVNYSYDGLSRLSGAWSTGPEWGQSYSYDGFGNRTAATVTKGSAPSSNLAFNPATNRIVGGPYDANGNSGGSFDFDNRLVGTGWESYGYAPDNKRIYRGDEMNGAEEWSFYGVEGRKLGTFTVEWGATPEQQAWATRVTGNLYFAGRALMAQGAAVIVDRQGSVVQHYSERLRYFPWGEERNTTTQRRDKFATYYRDGTGLDYAQQRYYDSTLGRFRTPDPYRASGGLATPQSWNRYAYVLGDPVNYYDPTGLMALCPPGTHTGPDGMSCAADNASTGGGGVSGVGGGNDGMEVVNDGNPGGGGGEPPPIVGSSGLKYYGLYSGGTKYDVVKARIEEMNERLDEDPDCLKWLQSGTKGGYADATMRAVLAEMSRVAGRIERDGNNAPGIAATALDVPGLAIIVNGQGAFFYSGTGPTTNNQILILLHELAHVTGAPGFNQNDGDDRAGSSAREDNAALLREKCGKTISP